MTLPSMASILQGIFPDATEVEKVSDKDSRLGKYIIKFDPQKFQITPAHTKLLGKLEAQSEKIIYNEKTNQMEIHAEVIE